MRHVCLCVLVSLSHTTRVQKRLLELRIALQWRGRHVAYLETGTPGLCAGRCCGECTSIIVHVVWGACTDFGPTTTVTTTSDDGDDDDNDLNCSCFRCGVLLCGAILFYRRTLHSHVGRTPAGGLRAVEPRQNVYRVIAAELGLDLGQHFISIGSGWLAGWLASALLLWCVCAVCNIMLRNVLERTFHSYSTTLSIYT